MTETALPTLPAALYQLVAALLAQASGGDSASLVRVAADETEVRTQARAVSILVASGGVLRARAGDWSPAVQPKLDAWERALVKRVKQGATAISDGPIPVSAAQIGGWMVCMAPLSAGRQAVGALSLCVEPAREREVIRTARDLSPWLGAILARAQRAETGHRQLAALKEIACGHAGPRNVDAKVWLRKSVERCAVLLQAQGGLVVSPSETGEHLLCLAAVLPNEALDWTGARFKSSGILHHVCVSGETFLSNDPAADSRYAPDVEGALVEPLQSILAVPLYVPDGERGALAILNRRDVLGFTASDAELLQSAAACISTDLQNASLRRAATDCNGRMAVMQRALRAEIAGTMHQGAIQMLAAVAMGLDHLEHLAAVQPDALPNEIKSLKDLTREATREARLLLSELHPASLGSEGLVAAMESYLQQMPGGGDKVDFQHRGPLSRIDTSVAEVAFHVAVQGLRHAHKHGSAAHVWLTLSLADEVLSILIEDDGKPQAERRCARHDQEFDCPEYMSQQLAQVSGTLQVRAGGPGEKPAFLIRIPARMR